MQPDIPGLHHVTAVAGDPRQNLAFYTHTLGLRLVKKSVNQDDVSVYHLFYGDHRGSPGTSMTFFPYLNATQGRAGTGQATTTGFLIPESSIEYWRDRLAEAGISTGGPIERFGEPVLQFDDPDGLGLELVGVTDPPDVHPPEGPVPPEHAIRGFQGVTLTLEDADGTIRLLEKMGFEETGSKGSRRRFEGHGDLGYAVDVVVKPEADRGLPGAGVVHHIAFQISIDKQEAWRDVLRSLGLRPTEIIDRKWFESVYTRTPGGVLFEFATLEPGYTVDEELDSLGESLALPPWLEDRRSEIEADLPDLQAAPNTD